MRSSGIIIFVEESILESLSIIDEQILLRE